MKIKQLATAVLGALALSSGMAFESNKAQAQGVRFDCVRAGQGGFVTILTRPNQPPNPLITWNSQAFSNSGYTPERRCYEVTQRLNYAVENGIRLRLTTGTVTTNTGTKYNVICALQGRERRCSENTFNLVTLTPDADPYNALYTLVNAGNASGRPLAQSGSVTLDDWMNSK